MVSQSKNVGAEDVAEVREDREDRLEFDFCRMKAGLGGDRAFKASKPSLLSCNSRREVSARDDNRSWEEETPKLDDCLWRGLLGRVEDELEWREVIEGEEWRDARLEFLLSERRDEEEAERGAATGMITPFFFMADRENLGAEELAEKSTSSPGEGVGVF